MSRPLTADPRPMPSAPSQTLLTARLRGAVKRIVSQPTIGRPMAHGLARAGASQLSRRLSASTGEPAPDVAVVSLPSRLFASDSLRMRTEGGTDQIAKSIWSRGWRYWERPLPAFFAATVHDGDVVLDIGANTGFYSLLAASVGPTVSVHAFEPLPPVAQLLQMNLELNEQGRQVTVLPDAVDEVAGETELYVPTSAHGLVETSASLQRSFRSEWSFSVTVPRQTVDGYSQRLARVDVLKIDAECMERQVLEGARDTLLRERPVAFLEVMNCDDWRSDVDALDSLRRDLGYVSVRLRPREAILAAAVGYDEPWRNQALWPAERLDQLRHICKRLRCGLRDESQA